MTIIQLNSSTQTSATPLKLASQPQMQHSPHLPTSAKKNPPRIPNNLPQNNVSYSTKEKWQWNDRRNGREFIIFGPRHIYNSRHYLCQCNRNNATNNALNLTLSHSSVTLATPVDFTTDAKYTSLATQYRSNDIAYNVHADKTTRKFVGSRIGATMKIPPAADKQDRG